MKVITLDPLLPWRMDWVMGLACKAFASHNGNERVIPEQNPTIFGLSKRAIEQDADHLDEEIRRLNEPAIVFGWSRGATVGSTWLDKYGHAYPKLPLTFIFIGNPSRSLGSKKSTALRAPEDTDYPVFDIAREGDSWADAKNSRPGVHVNYFGVDLNQLPKPVATKGNTRYFIVP